MLNFIWQDFYYFLLFQMKQKDSATSAAAEAGGGGVGLLTSKPIKEGLVSQIARYVYYT